MRQGTKKRGDERTEIKCTPEELKELLNIKNAEIKIDGTRVRQQIAPSIIKTLKETGTIDSWV